MIELKIIDQNFQEYQITLEKIQEWISQAQQITQENTVNFHLEQITKQISNYLEIFLLNPQNSLTLKQLKDLIAQNLKQNNFPNTALTLERIIQLGSTELHLSQWESRLANIYQIRNLTGEEKIEAAIKKTSLTNDLQEQLTNLISNKLFFPSHNFFNSKYHYDQEEIFIKDNLESIFENLHQFTNNFLKRISTTIDFSHLRPKLSIIKSSQNRSAGPVTFIKIYTDTIATIIENNPTEYPVKQVISLSSDHPDLLEYLVFLKNLAAQNYHHFLQFRLKITTAFMESYFQKQDFELIDPYNQQTANTLNADNTFNLILEILQESSLLELTFPNFDLNPNNHKSICGIIDLKNFIDKQTGGLNLELLKKTLNNGQKILDHNNTKNKLKINFCGFFQFLEELSVNSNSAHALETLNQIAEQIRSILPKNLVAEISCNTPLVDLISDSSGLDHPSIANSSPEFHLQIQQIFEQNFSGKIDKNIYLNPNSSENLTETILMHLGKMKYLRVMPLNSSESPIHSTPPYQSNLPEKNFLLNVTKIKKRSHQQIQPPLFPLKKTEEVFLPPINSLHD